jgi:type II secretory pathway pseudopilin PulG
MKPTIEVARCFSPRSTTPAGRVGRVIPNPPGSCIGRRVKYNPPCLRAFTVVELLVAAAITAVIASLMLSLVSNVLGGWNRSHGTLETEAQARLALDQIAQDIQGALFKNDGNVWLAAAIEDVTTTSGLWLAATTNAKPSSVSVDPATALADMRFGRAGVWLRLISARPSADATSIAPSAPAAVGYQLIRALPPTATTGGEAHYVLYRAEVSAANTFAAGYNLDPTAGGYRTASVTDGNAGNLLSPPPLRFIADNVVDFGVRLYTRDAATGALTLVFPVSNAAADLTHLAKSPPTATTLADRFPDVADVMLRVLTPQGVQQISALEAGTITGDWWTIATANSRVFTRRVVLNASSL